MCALWWSRSRAGRARPRRRRNGGGGVFESPRDHKRSALDVDGLGRELVVGVDAYLGGDLHRLLRQHRGILFIVGERARGRERIIAARADRRDAAQRFEHVAVTRDDERHLLVGDDHHRLQVAEIFVGAPILGKLDRGAQQLAIVALELRLEPLERSEEHTSELQSLMRISYAVFCLTKKKKT